MLENKYIIVPINEVGMEEAKNGISESENLEEFRMTIDEFLTLDKNNVFEIINDHFDKLIDEGEEESITAKQLQEVFMAISAIKGTWLDAINAAIKYRTAVYLYF